MQGAGGVEKALWALAWAQDLGAGRVVVVVERGLRVPEGPAVEAGVALGGCVVEAVDFMAMAAVAVTVAVWVVAFGFVWAGTKLIDICDVSLFDKGTEGIRFKR
jgi:hypothetical protein